MYATKFVIVLDVILALLLHSYNTHYGTIVSPSLPPNKIMTIIKSRKV